MLRWFPVLLAALLILLPAVPSAADIVRLKSNGKLEGEVTEVGDMYEVKTRAGVIKGKDQARWNAAGGWVRQFAPGADKGQFEVFEQRPLALERPDYFVTEQPDADRMTYTQLKAYVGRLAASGFDIVPQQVELERKLSFPFVTLIMTLIAVPFAVTTGRRGALYGVGVGIVLAMVYWLTISVFAAVGKGGLIQPWLAAWAPNLLFGAGAAYLLMTVRT